MVRQVKSLQIEGQTERYAGRKTDRQGRQGWTNNKDRNIQESNGHTQNQEYTTDY